MPRRFRGRIWPAIAALTSISLLVALFVSSSGSGVGAVDVKSAATLAPPIVPLALVPTAPRSVTVAPGNKSATVHWKTPASNNGSSITGYVVTPYIGNAAQHATTVGKVTGKVITGLQNSHAYSFRVAAKNARGKGPQASSVTITIGTPIAPTGASTVRGVRSAIVNWHKPAFANGSPITGYVVVPYLNGVAQKARSYSSTATKEVVGSLSVGRTYTFRVGARNKNGVGPRSQPTNVTNPTSTLRPHAPPPAGGYFSTLAVNATLPSEATCDGRVHYSSWEPRPQNGAANHRVPAQPLTVRNHPDFNSTWQAVYRPRITGNFTGTTEEIIQWAACKWGLSDEVLRAEAVDESHWVMNVESDYESRSNGHCTQGDSRDPCPTSFGILQIKWYFNPDSNPVNNSYPMSKNMTAFSLDYTAAMLRGCYQGWQYFGSKTTGDLWGCMGAWFAGSWRTSAALGYIARVQDNYNEKEWRNW